MKNITELKEWTRLTKHQKELANVHMRDLFNQDDQRFSQFSHSLLGLFIDFSKNRLTQETINYLCDLAEAQGLKEKIEKLFSGKIINTSEHRPALHTALRNRSQSPVVLDEINITPMVDETLQKMKKFSEAIRSQTLLGATGKPITDIVNVGIGGSHLGSMLCIDALRNHVQPGLHFHFVSNVDGVHLSDVLHKINPETALFIVSSKSFTTIETLTHADAIKVWLKQKLGPLSFDSQFAAVTANVEKALAYGIKSSQIFPIWDWVGGRYSVWSAVGLPVLIAIGYENFVAFLSGAHAMDQHFRYTDFRENLPVLMGLIGIWYINFFHANNHAVIPYSELLTHLPTYIQQADMESNGKSISADGRPLNYATGPIIWGEQGSNAQHAFHQLLHQGNHFTPVDFVLVGQGERDHALHQDVLIGSGLSQAKALLQGKNLQETLNEMITSGVSPDLAKKLAPHKVIPGNRPSNTIFISEMTPFNLGMLLALYEQKIFVQGAIWDINSFDQWGVELGKQLLPQILKDLKASLVQGSHDSSTAGLIELYKNASSKKN